jgi:hypothetical protein
MQKCKIIQFWLSVCHAGLNPVSFFLLAWAYPFLMPCCVSPRNIRVVAKFRCVETHIGAAHFLFYGHEPRRRNVDVLVSKLRKKLSDDNSIKIMNVPGRGYKFIIE